MSIYDEAENQPTVEAGPTRGERINMTEPRITHVCGGRNFAKVHRLAYASYGLMAADGSKLACGRTFHVGAGSAGWLNYPEDEHVGMCQQCRSADA